jgi:signal transduction histidine kinase
MAPETTKQPVAGRAARADGRREAPAACLIVHDDGDVVRASGWDRMFDVAAPEHIRPGAVQRDPLLAAVSEALLQAGETGGVAHSLVELDRPDRAWVSIAAASLALGGGAGTMVIIRSADDVVDSAGGKAIRKLEHDLRSPLTSISGAAELLESGRLGELSPEQIRCLGVVQRGAASLLGMLMAAAAPFRSAVPLENDPCGVVSGGETGEDSP